jgi:pimeloyl-ACP methyl ester carboxylesterase
VFVVQLAMACLAVATLAPAVASATASIPIEGFVEVNGVRLQYLDWGGSGPELILVHGLGDNPHVFDDVAGAFTDKRHVIAYARRASGGSEVKGPYDVATLTEDLQGLMDALGIAKADLLGYSAGGDEISEMAAQHPERVRRLVYFDGAYDWGTPAFKEAVKALPAGFFDPPAAAMASFDAFRSYQKAYIYPGLDDIGRIDANLRQKVIIQHDGSLKFRLPKELVDMLYAAFWSNGNRDYTRIRSPVLAIYSEHLYDLQVADGDRRVALSAYEETYWRPFQALSLDRLRRELGSRVQIVRVPGAHSSFFLTNRQRVVYETRRFLDGAAH